MKTGVLSRIVLLTAALATFVLLLCVSVSRLLPLVLIVCVVASLIVAYAQALNNYAEIKQFTQKNE